MSYIYPTSQLGRTITYQGKDYLHFSGTSYLGMGTLPDFKELLIQGIHKHGPNHGSSRNSNVQLPLYGAFEAQFAAGSGAAEAAVLSSGYMAGQLAVNTLKPLADLIWAAPNTHPAITLERQHPVSLSHKQWQKKCIAKSHELIGQRILLLSNAVNPLIPEIHDFEWTKKLSPSNKYYLLIDDSHAFGVLGEHLFGTYGQWKNLPVEVMIAGSLGKALGLPAGIILGNPSLIPSVRENPIYRTSSPPAPAFLSAFLDGQEHYLNQQRKLHENLHYVESALKGMEGFHFLPQYPVISFEKEAWVEKLHHKGFIISSFAYPQPDSPPVNRIILSAWHFPSDLDALIRVLKGL